MSKLHRKSLDNNLAKATLLHHRQSEPFAVRSDSDLITHPAPLTHYKTSSLVDDDHQKRQNEDHSMPTEYNDLLDYFKQKQSDNYRYIKFIIPDENATDKNYKKQVSFDTINLECDDDNEVQWDDAFGWDLLRIKEGSISGGSSDRERGRDRNLSPGGGGGGGGGGGRSPLASPVRGYSNNDYFTSGYSFSTGGTGTGSPNLLIPGNLPPEFENLIDTSMLQNLPKRPEYPTSPILTHRGCTLSKKHKHFEKLYKNALISSSTKQKLKPVLPHRSILIYLSGRKHTWVALDWILNNFLENGDSIIICCSINSSSILHHKKRKNSFYSPHGFLPPTTPKSRFLHRNKPEMVPVICQNLMDYIETILNPNKIIKITIEFLVGPTKLVLKEMYKLYEPNLVCTGTKPNLRISAPLRSWNSSKLTDRLVKNFPLPVIVVPAVNMNKFEYNLENKFKSSLERVKSANIIASESNSSSNNDATSSSMTTDVSLDEKLSLDDDDDDDDDEQTEGDISNKDNADEEENADDESSIEDSIEEFDGDDKSITSENSDASDESYSSFEEISKLYYDYKKDLATGISTTSKNRKSPSSATSTPPPTAFDYHEFINDIKLISDKSMDLCNEIRSLAPDYQGNGSKLARAITGSNLFDVVPYKTKSMLAPLEPKSTSLSYKEMKRTLQLNAANAKKEKERQDKEETETNVHVPIININDVSPNISPTHSPSPPPLNSSLTFDLVTGSKPFSKKISSPTRKMLQKSLSHDIGTDNRPELQPLKSHPDLKSFMNKTNNDAIASNDSSLTSLSQYEGNGTIKKKKKKFWKMFT